MGKTVRAIFLDRDGVINIYPGDGDYVKSWEEFHFLPGAQKALGKLADNGYRIFIISNQAGVSKGLYSQKALDLITRNMLEQLSKEKEVISGVLYCTHRQEENCSCRKPQTGMIDMAVSGMKKSGLKVDLAHSYFIGDTMRDIITGNKAGLKTILVFSGKEKPENKPNWDTLPDFTAEDLISAVEKIILK